MAAPIEFLTSALAATALAAAFWLRRHFRLRGAAACRPADALAICRPMLKLLAALQQHRGMASGWLAGDANFGPRMEERRREIERLFAAIALALVPENACAVPCMTLQDFRLLRHRWQELLHGLGGLSVDESIARHTAIIARILLLLDAVGETRIGLTRMGSLPQVGNFARRLPALTEALGQARAIGTGVAARGACSPVDRVRLLFLISRAETLLQQAQADAAASHAAGAASRLVAELAAVLRTEMLHAEGVRVASADYFAMATRAIDSVFAWIDASGSEIAAGIAARMQTPAGR
ncbi:MAG: nitrate- and nitrite sensing domain-containing protein [Rhodocyclaceae bacterium]|nr:nitrate- and nitrite sensing domain-containing protein [Rhodocyclaceae bacterium]